MSTEEYPEPLRELIDDYLAGLRFASEAGPAPLDEFQEAMRYSLLAGGSGCVPSSVSRAPRPRAPSRRACFPPAAIELIHTYSLIHDDLPAMDDDEMRRGRPTSHVKFGEDVAILAGDGLFAEAINLFLTEQEGDLAHVNAALRELRRRPECRAWWAASTST